jgi:hypothetical protein
MFTISQATGIKIWDFLEQGNTFFFNFHVEPVLDKLEKKQNHVGPGR